MTKSPWEIMPGDSHYHWISFRGAGQKRVLIASLLVWSPIMRADMVRYGAVKELRVESKELIVRHHHDWGSEAGIKWRYAMMMGDQDPFKVENIYSTITVEEKSGKKVLFTRPVPALTYLRISPDSRYIVGLSNIKLENPFQLVIFDRVGNLLLKQHINPQEACFSAVEYGSFRKQHPESLPLLDPFTSKKDDRVWVDCFRMDTPRRLGKSLWNDLYKRVCPSHFSPNFSGSVTNSITWYRTEILKPAPIHHGNGKTILYYNSTHPPQPADPELKLIYRKGHPVELSLLDPTGERFSVPIPAP